MSGLYQGRTGAVFVPAVDKVTLAALLKRGDLVEYLEPEPEPAPEADAEPEPEPEPEKPKRGAAKPASTTE